MPVDLESLRLTMIAYSWDCNSHAIAKVVASCCYGRGAGVECGLPIASVSKHRYWNLNGLVKSTGMGGENEQFGDCILSLELFFSLNVLMSYTYIKVRNGVRNLLTHGINCVRPGWSLNLGRQRRPITFLLSRRILWQAFMVGNRLMFEANCYD